MPIELPPPPRRETARTHPGTWLLLLLQVLTLGGLALFFLASPDDTAADKGLPQRSRAVASKLKAAGALAEAGTLYERFLDAGSADAESRAAIAFSLGKLYLEQGRYEKALRWFYEAEALEPPDLQEELGKKIVHALEALGRVHAAKAVLARRTQLDQPEVQRPESDPLVARIGKDEIRRSDVTRALDNLPPFMKQHFGGEAGPSEFLRKYVADELIFRKAQKMEYDRDPEVRRQLESLLKQLVVARFVEKEILGKLQVTRTDLENHFQAKREKYDQPEAVRLRLIKVASLKKATEIKARLAKGASFADLAGSDSLDKATSGKGGSLERWIERGASFLGEGDGDKVSQAIFATPRGQVSEPLSVGDHYYLFKIEQVREGKQRTLEEVKDRVETDYRMTKSRAAYTDMIQQTLSAEDVELHPERMKQSK